MAYTKYSLTPANNTAAPPDGAPEGMLPSAVNDTMRDMMAQIRDVGDGVRDGTYTMTTPKITGGTITGVTLTGNTLTNPVITGATLTTSAFNGTVGATTASTGAFTTLSTSSTTTLSGLTASTALALDASKNVVSVTNTGTGNNVLSASPTLTGTIAGASLSLSSLTSGRVTYAGASGLLTDSSNLTWNGSALGVTGAITQTGSGGTLAFNQNQSASGAIVNKKTTTASNSLGAYDEFATKDNTGTSNTWAVGVNVNSANSSWELYNGGTRFSVTQTGAATWSVGGTRTMDLTSTGLGIGTSSPATKLNIENAGECQLQMAYSSTIFGRVGRLSSGNYEFSSYENGGSLLFGTTTSNGSTTERMRIDSSGTLFIGATSSPSGTQRLVLTANGSAGIEPMLFNELRSTSATENYVLFYRNGSQVGSITNTLSATAYVTSSDYRLKENITPMTGALAIVAQLKPVTYKWKVDGSDGQGFIAHELQEVVPNAVVGSKDAIDSDGKPKYQGIDTSFLVATLTKAIQEQQALIESLTTRLTALEN
jgi:hypothetical protein